MKKNSILCLSLFLVVFLTSCSYSKRNQKMLTTKTSCNLLTLVDYHNPILRQKANPIKFPLSEQDKQLIRDMKYSIQKDQLKKANAPFHSAAGMAANQWGSNKRIFLFCPTGDAINGLEVVINPSYEPIVETATNLPIKELGWEGCFSIPLATGNVERYKHIKVKYQNEDGKTIVRQLSDWEAKVWQHENDHLNGWLYDDLNAKKCIEKKQFNSIEELDKFYLVVRKERKKF